MTELNLETHRNSVTLIFPERRLNTAFQGEIKITKGQTIFICLAFCISNDQRTSDLDLARQSGQW